MNEARSTIRCAAINKRTSWEGQGERAGLVRKRHEFWMLAYKDDPTVYKIFRDIEIFGGKGCLLDPSGVRVDRPQFIQARVKHQFKIVRVLN